MKCPYCNYPDSKVIDSRPSDEAIRRRRECVKCGGRFTTYERIEKTPLMVVKKDKTVESFDPDKLLNGMIRSCEKRPVKMATLEAIVGDIEKSIRNEFKKEVSSAELGRRVMEALKEVDEVAYVRFASVYRQFKDVSSFMDELSQFIDDRKREKK